MRSDNPKLAVLYSLAAAFLYALGGFLVQAFAKDIPNPMIIFFRIVFSLFFLAPILTMQLPSMGALKTKSFPLHLLRAFTSLSAMFCLYYALKFLPLVDVLLLTYTRPLFIPVIVYFWFGKKWTKQTFLGLVIGFLGVVLILKPTEHIIEVASLIGLASGLFGALAFTTIRRLTKTEFPDKILFYYLILALPISAISLVQGWISLNWHIFFVLLAIGFVATLYQLCLTRAYRHAKAFKVGSLLYSTVIFGALFQWLFLDNLTLDIPTVIGMVLIFLGSFLVMKVPSTKVPREK
ncbi:MAG: DMT family transporter [Simkaniaceae bacterium]